MSSIEALIEIKKEPTAGRHFIVCSDCYWIASIIADHSGILACPVCDNPVNKMLLRN